MVRDKAERLVNLTSALLENRQALTFEEIRRRLRGTYDQDDPESARRMFERDKRELRGLNIPLTTTHDLFTGIEGYTIDRASYELAPLDLTPEEATALLAGVAISGWDSDRLAATRLTTDATDSPAAASSGGLSVSLDADHLDTVAAAVTTRTTITFAYRSGDGTPSRRTLDPWSVGIRNGVGYVLGHDHDRDDRRIFRLSRIASSVDTEGEPGAFQPPAEIDLAAELRAPFGDGTTVEVVAAPDAVSEVVARGGRRAGPSAPGGEDPVHEDPVDDAPIDEDAWVPMVLTDADPVRLFGWLVTHARRVVVVAPADLRARVHDHLAAVVAAGSAGA